MLLIFVVLILVLAIGGAWFIAGMTPWAVSTLDEDLTIMLLLWLTGVLFANSIEKISFAAGPDLSLARIIWILLAFVLFSRFVTGKNRLLSMTKVEIAMVVFVLLALASKLFLQSRSAELTDPGISKLLNGYVFPFSMFFISKHVAYDAGKIRKIFIFVVWAGLYLSLTALGEHFSSLHGFVFPRIIMDPNAGIHWGRARGPFLNAAANGTVLGMIFPVVLFLAIQEKAGSLLRKFSIGVSLLIPVALYFTYTRACWLGLIAAAVCMALFYPQIRKVFIIAAIGLAVLAAVKFTATSQDVGAARFRDQSPIYDRIYLNDVAWRMFFKKPIFGYGLDSFPHISFHYFKKIKGVPYHALRGLVPHNTFLAVLVELGVVGFLPLILIYYFIFKNSVGHFFQRPREDVFARGLVVVLLAMSGAYFLNMTLIDMRFFLFPNALFFIMAGMVAGSQQRQALLESESRRREFRPGGSRTGQELQRATVNKMECDHAV
ncbi:MAG: O-antigen ligase family protein [Candidatus Firestonebacteria bacterium]|nr:O-antigen ligase family protein [Candidatus Firestonebacteria bacterium]